MKTFNFSFIFVLSISLNFCNAQRNSSVVASEGQSAALECLVSSDPRAKIIWGRENNASLPIDGITYNGKILKINAIQKEDRGTYNCIADNGISHSERQNIELKVEFAPKITVTQSRVGQALGFDIELKCQIEAYPTPAIVWYMDNMQLLNNKHFDISNIVLDNYYTNTTLKIMTVKKHQYGNYKCMAFNKLGGAEKNIHLFETQIQTFPPQYSIVEIDKPIENYFCSKSTQEIILKKSKDFEDMNKFCESKMMWECDDDYVEKVNISSYEFVKLEFQNISIVQLPIGCLTTFRQIRKLNANNSEIEKIDDFAKYYKNFLEILNLSRNKIEKIEGSKFQYLQSLNYLDLSFNRIKVMDNNFFSKITKSLEKIDFSNNQLKQFDEQLLNNAYNQNWNLNINLEIYFGNNLIEKFIPTYENCALHFNKFGFKLTVDLSNNHLKSIRSKCDISVLNLSDNQLEEVKTNATEIIADNNKVKKMEFFNNPNFVSLKNNDLQLLDYVNFLSNFKNVLKLDISNNDFQTLKIETFADMKKLKKLSLRGIGLTKIPFGLFGHLKNLEYLDLSYNQLLQFEEQKFVSFDNLKTLDLSGNKLHENLFKAQNIRKILPNLEYIGLEAIKWNCGSLSYIKMILNQQGIELLEAAYPTKESTVELKEVTKILIENVTFEAFPVNLIIKFSFLISLTITADIKTLNSSDFINASHLEKIDLSNNEIKSLQNAQFKNLVNIKTINLAYNKIEFIDNNAFTNIGCNLTYIDLSHNQLATFREDFIAAMIFNQDSITINLSFNWLNKFMPAYLNFPNNTTQITLNLGFNNFSDFYMKNSIYEINLSNNELNEIDVEATNIIAEYNRIDSFKISNKIEMLSFGNNRLISLKWDKNLSKLIELDLSHNGMFLSELQDLFPAVTNLEILDLSNNKIDYLNLTEAFRNLTNLRHLSIMNIQSNEISENTFKSLNNLESLVISHNPLNYLNLNYFKTLKNLKTLKIDHTSLYTIKEYTKVKQFMPNLLKISIDGNAIHCRLLESMYEFFESNGIEIIEPEKFEYHHHNVKGIQCVDVNQDIMPIIDVHDSEEIAYKLEEIMQHVRVLEEKQKQERFGISMQQLIISNIVSIAVTFLIFFIALSIAKLIRNNRYKGFNEFTMDSQDIEILAHEL